MGLLSTIWIKFLSLCFSVFLIHLASHCSLLFANWKTNKICRQFMRKTRSQLSFARWNLCNTTKKSINIYIDIFKLWNTSWYECIRVSHTLKCNAGQTRQCNQQQEVLSKHCVWHYLAPLPVAHLPCYPCTCTHSVTQRKRKCGTKASSILASAFDICEHSAECCCCSSSQINPHDTLAYRNKHIHVDFNIHVYAYISKQFFHSYFVMHTHRKYFNIFASQGKNCK